MANRKVLGIVCIVAGCVVLGFVGLGAWWSSKQRELRSMGIKTEKRASAFAKTHDEEACVKESIGQLRKCDGLVCRAVAGVFLDKCLPLSRPTPGFCSGDPKHDEIMAAATWAVGYCQQRAPDLQQECARMVNKVAEHCERPRNENGGAITAPPKAKTKRKKP